MDDPQQNRAYLTCAFTQILRCRSELQIPAQRHTAPLCSAQIGSLRSPTSHTRKPLSEIAGDGIKFINLKKKGNVNYE